MFFLKQNNTILTFLLWILYNLDHELLTVFLRESDNTVNFQKPTTSKKGYASFLEKTEKISPLKRVIHLDPFAVSFL
jgi:hypothetical protein